MTCHIKSLIRKRRRVHNKIQENKYHIFWNQFKVLRHKITNLIWKSKQDYFDKLENMFINENYNSKLFWKTSKQLLRLGKTTNNIPRFRSTMNMPRQKANMLNKYFSSQSIVASTRDRFTWPSRRVWNYFAICQGYIWWPWCQQILWHWPYESPPP